MMYLHEFSEVIFVSLTATRKMNDRLLGYMTLLPWLSDSIRSVAASLE